MGLFSWNSYTYNDFAKALENGDSHVVDVYLRDHKEVAKDLTNTRGTPILVCLVGKSHSTMRVLLKHEFDVNCQDKISGCTPLIEAAKQGNVAAAELLLNYGARVESHDYMTGRTPLIYAVRGRHVKTVELLLKRGANPRVTDNHGNDAFFYANPFPSSRHSDKKIKEIVNLLKTACNKLATLFPMQPSLLMFEPAMKKPKKKRAKKKKSANENSAEPSRLSL